MRENEAMALLVLARGISWGRREAAIKAAGSALDLLADPAAFARELGEGGVAALRMCLKKADALLESLHQDGVHLVMRGDAGYPRLLAHIAQPPHLLFVKGNPDLNAACPLAMVGTRRASAYGLRHTRMLAKELAAQGMSIVSGLALGVDAAAHEGALDAGGHTIAVLGSSLDRLYPRENAALAERILAGGGSVVSEYAPGTDPTRYTFPQRNRIVAGMSLGVLVTDAPRRSGAQITVSCALAEGREVFALPGDVDRQGSQLPNLLIAEGAKPVLSARDVLDALSADPIERKTEKPKRRPRRTREETPAKAETSAWQEGGQSAMPPPGLDENGRVVWSLLAAGDKDFDTLCEMTGMSGEEMGALLMMMEIEGFVEALAGLAYRIV